MSKNILILSDSLAGPLYKKKQNLVYYEETWPYLLKREKSQSEIAQCSVVSATMVDMVRQAEYWKPFDADITIIQLGLNDCQPRILKLHEKNFLSQYKWGKALMGFIARHGIITRKLRKLTYTKKEDFLKAIKDIKAMSNKVIWIGIACHPEIDVSRLPGLRKLIDEYNQILGTEVKDDFIDLKDLKGDAFTIDHLHLSADGHKQVLQKIIEKI